MIDFNVTLGDQVFDSTTAIAKAPELAGSVARPWDLQGEWVARDEEADRTWRLADALVPLLTSVCLETIPPLVRTGHARACRLTEYGSLRLDVEGDWMRLGGDDLPHGRVPRTAFLHGQLGAVGRLISLLGQLGLDGFDTKLLREDRRAALEALATASWPAGPEGLPPIPASAPRRDAEGDVAREGVVWACGAERFVLPGEWEEWKEAMGPVARALREETSAVLPLRHSYGYVRFDFEGAWVRLSGDGLADLRLPLAGFLSSLE